MGRERREAMKACLRAVAVAREKEEMVERRWARRERMPRRIRKVGR